MENEIIIDKFNFKEYWKEFSQDILKEVVTQLKILGYDYHKSSESLLNSQDIHYWFKHPQRIAKLDLNIKSDTIVSSDNVIELNEIHISLALDNSFNIITNYWVDYPSVKQSLADITNIKNNTFEYPTLNFSGLSKITNEIKKYDMRVFKTVDDTMDTMTEDLIEYLHGRFNNKNSDFSSLENYIAWLEWLGIDVLKFAISHDINSLLPQTVKDVFIF